MDTEAEAVCAIADGQRRTGSRGGIYSGAPGILATRIDALVNWARANSLWPMPFNTACCGIEFMAAAASRYDFGRFGMERLSFSPRQADLLLCAGRVTYKMAPVLRRIWEQMPQPKWSIAMGACASSGGVFDVYSMVQGIDTIIPVDVYVPGCPPRVRPGLAPAPTGGTWCSTFDSEGGRNATLHLLLYDAARRGVHP